MIQYLRKGKREQVHLIQNKYKYMFSLELMHTSGSAELIIIIIINIIFWEFLNPYMCYFKISLG